MRGKLGLEQPRSPGVCDGVCMVLKCISAGDDLGCLLLIFATFDSGDFEDSGTIYRNLFDLYCTLIHNLNEQTLNIYVSISVSDAHAVGLFISK